MAEFQDLFTELSDTDIEDHTPDAGTGWTLESGTKGNCQVAAAQEAVRQQSTGGVWVSDNKANANHYTKFSMAQNGNGLYSDWFTCVRLVDDNDFIGVEQDTVNSSRLVKVVAGTKTTLVDMTHAATDAYEIRAEGNTIQVYLNTVQQGSDQTVTDHNTETSQGFALVGSARVNGHFDDYYADEIAGGGGTNINATSASLSITEHAATVNAATNVNASAYSLSITAYNATVNAATNIQANAATLNLSAQNSTINAATNINANTASLSFTTYPATLAADINISANSASLTISPQSATVNATTNINSNSAALTIAPLNATVSLGVNISGSVVNLSIISQNATVSYNINIQTSAGTLSFSTYSATIATGAVIIPTSEGLEYTIKSNRLGYDFPIDRINYDFKTNRINYDFKDEDL